MHQRRCHFAPVQVTLVEAMPAHQMCSTHGWPQLPFLSGIPPVHKILAFGPNVCQTWPMPPHTCVTSSRQSDLFKLHLPHQIFHAAEMPGGAALLSWILIARDEVRRSLHKPCNIENVTTAGWQMKHDKSAKIPTQDSKLLASQSRLP